MSVHRLSGADGQLNHALGIQQIRSANLGSLNDRGLVQDVAVNLNKGVALHEDRQSTRLHDVHRATSNKPVGHDDLATIRHADGATNLHVSGNLGRGNPVSTEQLRVEVGSDQKDFRAVVVLTELGKRQRNIGGSQRGGRAGGRVVLLGRAVRSQSRQKRSVNAVSNGSDKLAGALAKGITIAGQNRLVGELDRLTVLHNSHAGGGLSELGKRDVVAFGNGARSTNIIFVQHTSLQCARPFWTALCHHRDQTISLPSLFGVGHSPFPPSIAYGVLPFGIVVEPSPVRSLAADCPLLIVV